jgi:D-threo-aldose 1-dehydrogenase
VLARVRKIDAVCHTHGVALVEAALRFPFGHPSVVSVIPGAAHPREVARNVRTLAAKVPHALWTDLRAAGLIREDAPLPR